MLGLRFFNNVQIDLWQGDPEAFVSDMAVNANDLIGPTPKRRLSDIHKEALESSSRHVAISVRETEHAATFMKDLKTFLHTLSPPRKSLDPMTRVTFIALNRSIYEALQHELFETFEDDLDDDLPQDVRKKKSQSSRWP